MCGRECSLRASSLSGGSQATGNGRGNQEERGAPREGVGNLSTNVFEQRTATGTEAFSLLTCLNATTFILQLQSVLTIIETVYLNICAKPLPINAIRDIRSLPIAVRHLKRLCSSFLVTRFTHAQPHLRFSFLGAGGDCI